MNPTNAQGYITHVATRAIFLIEADNPVIGLMAFVPVGMVEVSSCLIAPEIIPGHHVAKGNELGHLQSGGSTHWLIFRPCAIADVNLGALPQLENPDAPRMLVRSRLATATTDI